MTARHIGSSISPVVRLRCLKAVALTLWGLGTWGCSLDFVPEENKPKESTEEGDLGAFVDLTLTSGAPSTVSLQSGVAFNIPEGSLSRDLEVRLERPRQALADEYAALWTGGERPLTAPHIISPYGVELAKTAILTLPLEGQYSGEYVTTLWLENASDTTWEALGPAPVKSGRAFVPLNQLGIFMLVEFDPSNFDLDGGLEGLSLDDFKGWDGDIPEQFRR